MKYKKTQQIIADNLTKLLGPVAFKKFLKCLGLTIKAKAAKRAEQN